MSTIDGSLIRHAARAACLMVLLALPAAAQQQHPVDPSTQFEFFPRYDFHLSAASLGSGDQRFSWDTHFGGELDVADYVKGRTSVVIDYEAVLGSELRPFDPNQGNYTLEASSSWRVGEIEVVGMFHHVSRHLGDRDKSFAIAWNDLGARVLNRTRVGRTTVDVDADLAWVTQRAYVDYLWIGNANVRVRRQVGTHADAFAHGSGQLFGISADASKRSTQVGGLVEAGVRLAGTKGAIELFVGYERRVDADPLDFQPHTWPMAGFRLVNR